MEKILFYDLETTGTRFWKNGIHQIAGMIVIDGEIKEKFNYHVCPNPTALIEPEALKVAGVTEDQVLLYPPMLEVYSTLIKLLSKYVDKFNKQDKFFLAGYNNSSFDDQFLRAFFTQCRDEYFGSWFWVGSIDVMVLSLDLLKSSRHKMFDFKLKTVAQYLGINVEKEKLHEALYDIELTKKIYDKIKEYHGTPKDKRFDFTKKLNQIKIIETTEQTPFEATIMMNPSDVIGLVDADVIGNKIIKLK